MPQGRCTSSSDLRPVTREDPGASYETGENPPADERDAAWSAADATSPARPLLKERFQFSSGKNSSVIAHLTQKGKPALTKYTNDLRAAKHGGARDVVRHVAAAPAVQVLMNRKVATGAVKNPHQATIKALGGIVDITVRLAAEPRTTVLKADDVTLALQTSTIVSVWGDAKEGTLQLTTRVVAPKG